jgi:hypothetical protein
MLECRQPTLVSRLRLRRRHSKTISKQGLSGQQGVNFIERIVLEMGSRWTTSGPNEVGIDGYIELFDPNSHEALGLTIAAQSKVMSALATESKPTFDFWCSPNDVEYWLNGNTPVILIVSNPPTNEAYWVSVKGYFKDWVPKASTTVTFVKSEQRFGAGSFRQLLTIAAAKAGLYLAPTRRSESLHSNLLPLTAYPSELFIAATDYRFPREIWAELHKSGREVDAAWILWEKKILSFHDLGEPPWSTVCDAGTREGFAVTEWSESSDAQRQRQFVQLLNRTLRDQLWPKVRYWPEEDCYAMFGEPRKLSYRSLKRSSQISVTSRFSSENAQGQRFDWFRHMAFCGQFRFLEGHWYLEITPTYRFTSDGWALDRFHEERLSGIKRIEGNRAVLSAVLFWADYLQPKTSLFGGRAPFLQFGELLTFDCNVGIVDGDWLAGDPGFSAGTGQAGSYGEIGGFRAVADEHHKTVAVAEVMTPLLARGMADETVLNLSYQARSFASIPKE